MITSLQAANIFIKKSLENGNPLTHMQIQKLVYFLHGWWYAVYNERIIKDDVEAWKHGPVYPLLYDELKEWGDSGVTSEILLENQESFSDDKNLANKVYKVLSKYEAWELSNMTHHPDTPWYEVYTNPLKLPFVKSRIGEELIKKHFQNAFRESTAA